MKTIFIHSSNEQPKKVEIKLSTTVSELIKQLKSAGEQNSGDKEHYDVFLVDVEKELNKEHTLESQGVSDKSNLLVTRCKKTQVLVVYNGVQFVDSYPSSAKFQSVFNKAIHHFGIGASEKDEFELYLTQEASSKINLSYPVGTYVTYPDCRLQVYLIKPSSFQGYGD